MINPIMALLHLIAFVAVVLVLVFVDMHTFDFVLGVVLGVGNYCLFVVRLGKTLKMSRQSLDTYRPV